MPYTPNLLTGPMGRASRLAGKPIPRTTVWQRATAEREERICIAGDGRVVEVREERRHHSRSSGPTETSRSASYDDSESIRNAGPPRKGIDTSVAASSNLRSSKEDYNSVGDDSGYASTGSDDCDTEDTDNVLSEYILEPVPGDSTHSLSSYVRADCGVETRPRSPSRSSDRRSTRNTPREPSPPSGRRSPSIPDPVVSALPLSSFDPGQCRALVEGRQCQLQVGTGELFCRTCRIKWYDGQESTALRLTIVGSEKAIRHGSPTSAILYIKGPFNPNGCHASTKKGFQCRNKPSKDGKFCTRSHLKKYTQPDPQRTDRPLPKRSFSLLELLKPKAKNVHKEDDLLRELLCDLSPTAQRDIRAEINKPLCISDREGFIYGFGIEEPTDPNYLRIKVGRSLTPDTRVETWISKCEKHCGKEVYCLDGYTKTKHHIRLESLVHLALEDIATFSLHLHPGNSGQAPSIVRQPRGVICKCGAQHKEEFRLKSNPAGREWEDDVLPLIRKWAKFVDSHKWKSK